MKQNIEELYSLSQSISYYRRKYEQKIEENDLKQIIKIAKEKRGKDFSYLWEEFENLRKEYKLVKLYDIVKHLKQEDVDTFLKIYILLENKEKSKKKRNITKTSKL